MLTVYEDALELGRSAERERDVDAVLDKMEKTVEARKEKLDALARLDEALRAVEPAGAEYAPGSPVAQKKENIAALLANLRAQEDKLGARLHALQASLSSEIQQNRDSRKFYASYVPHGVDGGSGRHIDTRQ